jgi:hypothetical protein
LGIDRFLVYSTLHTSSSYQRLQEATGEEKKAARQARKAAKKAESKKAAAQRRKE